MSPPPPLPNNSLLALQQQLYYRLRPWRDRLVHPVVVMYAALGLTPNTVSIAGAIAMVLFVIVAPYSYALAVICGLTNVISDITDGALARYLKIDSDKGKLVDITADVASAGLLPLGLVTGGFVSIAAGISLAALTVTNRSLRIFRHGQLLPTNWHFRAVAGFIPVVCTYALYVAFATAVTTPYNYLPPLAQAIIAILAGDTLITLFLLGHRK